jgi:hypothetical protein
MLRRIVSDLTSHASVAKELSLGLYEALSTLTRRKAVLEATYARHDAYIQSGLPGF